MVPLIDTLKGMRLGDVRVVVSSWIQPVPAVSLSPDFTAASDECIAETNKWLLHMFGTKEKSMMVGDDVLVVSPKTYERLKEFYHENEAPY